MDLRAGSLDFSQPLSGSGPRASAESFPISSSRVVEMNVGIDGARKNRELCCVDFFPRRSSQILLNRYKFTFRDANVAIRGADEQIEIAHALVG